MMIKEQYHQIRLLAIHMDIKANKCWSNNKINKNVEDWWEYPD